MQVLRFRCRGCTSREVASGGGHSQGRRNFVAAASAELGGIGVCIRIRIHVCINIPLCIRRMASVTPMGWMCVALASWVFFPAPAYVVSIRSIPGRREFVRTLLQQRMQRLLCCTQTREQTFIFDHSSGDTLAFALPRHLLRTVFRIQIHVLP